ncbi:MAG: NUDIX domain-containing protein [Bacteroidales bacterium]
MGIDTATKNNSTTRPMYQYEYRMPALTADVILHTDNEVLLIERLREPFKGKWAIPGGFVDFEEPVADAAARELKEETTIELSPSELSLFKLADKKGRDPRGWVLTGVYSHRLPRPVTAHANDDAAKAKWFDFDKLPDMAFDHEEILAEFCQSILTRSSKVILN